MLQQTVVKTVRPYFAAFVQNWPTVFELAACDLDDVLRCWAGLGYYARARNLHACAGEVVQNHQGHFPVDEKQLLALPGIGPYTASAIRAIAFGQKATVVDGNVERVVARLYALKKPLREIKSLLKQKAGELTPTRRPGDYAQAMMDLGATVCTPKSPDCQSCPIKDHCLAYKEKCAAELPVRAPKKKKPLRCGTAYLVLREDGAVLLRQRPAKGLLAKMQEIPSTPWREISGIKAHERTSQSGLDESVPVEGDWQSVQGFVTHTFTHFHLRLEVKVARVENCAMILPHAHPERCRWVSRQRLDREALPGVMRKIIAHAPND
jgi:A/G-specific adenine glycosylase